MLKVGLEIHTQLLTKYKLFSLAKNTTSDLTHIPNTATSFFDVSIPGTQPKLNPECILKAIKLAKILNCRINEICSFDRKHYFYGDQPLGYQITQHYHPIATNGSFKMLKRHYNKIQDDITIGIQQLQLEQDTGRSIYKTKDQSKSLIDFNRSNIPLIEMVTNPDFTSVEQVRAFLQTYIKTVRDLQICSGDLETGSIRVDVNVSVNEHQRVEIKNLPTISAIVNAIRYESKRQLKALNDKTNHDEVETRGWDGKTTFHLRSKESQVDYRYVPDMELPLIKLNVEDLTKNIKLPKSYGEQLDDLMSTYNINLRDAKMLLNDDDLLKFYKSSFDSINPIYQKKVINWLVHELMGTLTKSDLKFNSNIINIKCFNLLIEMVEMGKFTKPNAKLLLLHLINNKDDQTRNLMDLANEFDLVSKHLTTTEIDSIVQNVIDNNSNVINQILKGHVGKVNFLIGQCMRQSNGQIQPNVFESLIKSHLNL